MAPSSPSSCGSVACGEHESGVSSGSDVVSIFRGSALGPGSSGAPHGCNERVDEECSLWCIPRHFVPPRQLHHLLRVQCHVAACLGYDSDTQTSVDNVGTYQGRASSDTEVATASLCGPCGALGRVGGCVDYAAHVRPRRLFEAPTRAELETFFADQHQQTLTAHKRRRTRCPSGTQEEWPWPGSLLCGVAVEPGSPAAAIGDASVAEDVLLPRR